MKQKLTLNNKIVKAYLLRGNAKDLLIRLENSIDANINDANKLSEIMKNISGGSIISILKSDSSLVSFG